MATHKQSKPALLEKLLLAQADETPRGRAHYGATLTELGFVGHGLELLGEAIGSSANAGDKAGYWLEAQFAEAQRAYVRDVLLSAPDRAQEIADKLTSSKEGFGRALDLASDAEPKARAWIYAHLGATCLLMYWLHAIQPGRGGADFEAAKKAFEAALALQPDYAWCLRMQAFLYTLRGGKSEGKDDDFARAQEMLERASEDPQPGLDSVLDRNRAMLSSYRAAMDEVDLAERQEAARRGAEFGLAAVQGDSEDFVAAYFVAVNFDWLSRQAGDARTHGYREGRDAAIESAAIRAKNAISQATAIIAGLDLMRGKPEAARELADDLLAGRSHIDLETWGILLRDPLWKTLVGQMRDAMRQRLQP